ncbi:MAG: serine hydrolase, partial [Actinomycetota bacterium]
MSSGLGAPATRLAVAALVSCIALASSACARRDDAEDRPAEREVDPGDELSIPDGPAGKQLHWVVDVLRSGEPMSVDEVSAHFTPGFLRKVPPAELIGTMEGIAREINPFTVSGFPGPSSPVEIVALLTSPRGGTTEAIVRVERARPHRIAGLLFRPAAEMDPDPPDSWNELDRRLAGLARRVGFLAARLEGDRCVALHEIDASEPLAIGSAFKLYVLGELGRQVQAGAVSWDDNLAIRDEWKSIPSGDMRFEPEGRRFSLAYYARQMISVSDNTATDHLLHHLGRADVERAQEIMGHTRPDLNVPFLATRELSILKYG